MELEKPICEKDVVAIAPELECIPLSGFIETAEAFFSECFPGETEMSQNIARIVIKYLAAHFAVVSQGQIEMEKIGDATTKYKVETGTGLLATLFGQQALNLDPTGKLASLNQRNESYCADFEIFCT